MEVYTAIRSRRTVRDYKPDLIPQDLIKKILQCARWSPSSSNTQKWSFIAIQDRDTLSKLGGICKQGPFVGQAPFAVAVVMDDAPRPQLDAGRAIQSMELMAWSEGVGMCFVGVRDEDQIVAVKSLLNIPEKMDLITVLAFGYRADIPKLAGTPRIPFNEIIHWDKFGEMTQP
ncbi:MAG: nitroreductase family protein [Chloroflexi bacterium]|nr:nitroreductase family protein [Chloroflexota bacterium]